MTYAKLETMVKGIVEQSSTLKNKHTTEKVAPVNYVCIFTQSKNEYDTLSKIVKEKGKVVDDSTPSGPILQIPPIQTVSGAVQLIKIRRHDTDHPDRGDADFTVADYPKFKAICLSKPGFKLIQRTGFEMIELIDPEFEVRAYFSNPPLDKELNLV